MAPEDSLPTMPANGVDKSFPLAGGLPWSQRLPRGAAARASETEGAPGGVHNVMAGWIFPPNLGLAPQSSIENVDNVECILGLTPPALALHPAWEASLSPGKWAVEKGMLMSSSSSDRGPSVVPSPAAPTADSVLMSAGDAVPKEGPSTAKILEQEDSARPPPASFEARGPAGAATRAAEDGVKTQCKLCKGARVRELVDGPPAHHRNVSTRGGEEKDSVCACECDVHRGDGWPPDASSGIGLAPSVQRSFTGRRGPAEGAGEVEAHAGAADRPGGGPVDAPTNDRVLRHGYSLAGQHLQGAEKARDSEGAAPTGGLVPSVKASCVASGNDSQAARCSVCTKSALWGFEVSFPGKHQCSPPPAYARCTIRSSIAFLGYRVPHDLRQPLGDDAFLCN